MVDYKRVFRDSSCWTANWNLKSPNELRFSKRALTRIDSESVAPSYLGRHRSRCLRRGDREASTAPARSSWSCRCSSRATRCAPPCQGAECRPKQRTHDLVVIHCTSVDHVRGNRRRAHDSTDGFIFPGHQRCEIVIYRTELQRGSFSTWAFIDIRDSVSNEKNAHESDHRGSSTRGGYRHLATVSKTGGAATLS